MRGGAGGPNRGFTVFFGKNLEQVIELGHQKNEMIKFKYNDLHDKKWKRKYCKNVTYTLMLLSCLCLRNKL